MLFCFLSCFSHSTVTMLGRRLDAFGRTLLFARRNVEDNRRCKSSDIAKQFDVSPRTDLRYVRKLGFYERTAKIKPHLHPADIKRRKYWASERVVRLLAFWDTVTFLNESRFTVFPHINLCLYCRKYSFQSPVSDEERYRYLGQNENMSYNGTCAQCTCH